MMLMLFFIGILMTVTELIMVVQMEISLQNFKFKGISSHAAGAPQNGRSALDGVEAMNMMVNMLREHMDEEARIHYVITKGGLAPNVVPEEAEVYYYVRHPKVEGVRELFNRVVKAGEGAAQGTETQMTFEVMHGNYPLMPNKTLSMLVDKELNKLGGIFYNNEEKKFAAELYKTLINPDRVYRRSTKDRST